ncbi:Acetyl-CoA synthetase-like protein [Stemphylium lycopersici]|uniref:Acetyl-CoA synthetase-like protein n=1 Tax=Stemphylium lycopersici TaxID=183478 RepID=A0A364MX21_STELY|nr:hypothetical protein TW65_01182 [Stemphylium lycopersici]RAQ99223.1 Acetyl-CoA synthetase-like protein [Stemphylium lycopersici]RAR06046.1 Acetyl-CoA synthetase-like protein [Stemphylium lycopersici]
MQYTLLALATAATFVSAQSTIPLGENCTPDGIPCAGGANCYATNSMLQPRCGNFQASCTSDAQCAFNTCNLTDGLCNGFIAPSSTPAAPSTVASSTAPGWMPAPSPTIVAPAGSLPLGAECNPFVEPSQCANGVQCWASNAGLIAQCGKFNAACERDDQCATNTCNNGLCNGFLALSSSSSLPLSSAVATVNGTMMTMPTAAPSGSAVVGGNGTVLPTGGATPTSTGSVEFTGAASVEKAAGGVVALVFGAVALAL